MACKETVEYNGMTFYIYEKSIGVKGCPEVIRLNREPNFTDTHALYLLIDLGKKLKTDEVKGKIKELQGMLNL